MGYGLPQVELILNTFAENGFLCGYILLPPGFFYFSLDLSYLDNSITFILWYLKLLSGGLTLSPVPFRKRWALVVTDEQLFLCTVCYGGQKSFGDLNNV